MYKPLYAFDGVLEDVHSINKAIEVITDDPEPFFDEDTEEWKAWVEWRDGYTIIMQETAD